MCLEHSFHSTALSLSLVWHFPSYPPTLPSLHSAYCVSNYLTFPYHVPVFWCTGLGHCSIVVHVLILSMLLSPNFTLNLSLSLSAAGTERKERKRIACEYSRPRCPETQDQHSTILTRHKLTLHLISFITQNLAFLVYFV